MAKDLLKLRSTEDGLHIADSILWLDSHISGELTFLSSASSLTKTTVPQVIATEETVKILETYRKKPNALICQYNRPFSIGRLKMELLPSGSMLGGASLYVETEKGRLLYAPCLQPHTIPSIRKMQVKKAHALILGAYHADPTTPLPNRKKEKERLAESVKHYVSQKRYPIILCDPISIAQEITKLLSDDNIPLAIHPAIFKVNKVYESFGAHLGSYSLLSKRQSNPKVIILPKSARGRTLTSLGLPDGPIITIEDSLPQIRRDTTSSFATKVVATFHLSSYCDGPELKAIIQLVAPKEIYFFGPYAKRYVEEMKGVSPKVKPLFNNDQPTLF